MAQIITTQNLVAIKEVRHAGQQQEHIRVPGNKNLSYQFVGVNFT